MPHAQEQSLGKGWVRREGLQGCGPETPGGVPPVLVLPALAENQKKEPKALDTGEADRT